MLGRVLGLLPSYMLRRLAKADGKWNSGWYYHYNTCAGCFIGHAIGCVESSGKDLALDGHETDVIGNVSGWDAIAGYKVSAHTGTLAEIQYMRLTDRFGDERVGRAIEQRAARILAERAAERDIASIPSRESVHAGEER